MSNDELQLELPELCERAGVTVRTVRYYISQGLLPSPGQTGPGARYGQGHLDRLRLIRKLQREHLPLAEIRPRLEALEDAQVAALLVESGTDAKAPGSALDYVRAVLAQGAVPDARKASGGAPGSAAAVHGGRGGSSNSAPTVGDRGKPGRVHRPAAGSDSAADAFPRERAQWERLTLAEDIELHVRRPLSREQNRRVERLLQAARRLFQDED